MVVLLFRHLTELICTWGMLVGRDVSGFDWATSLQPLGATEADNVVSKWFHHRCTPLETP